MWQLDSTNILFNDRALLKVLFEACNESMALALAGYSMLMQLVLLPFKSQLLNIKKGGKNIGYRGYFLLKVFL